MCHLVEIWHISLAFPHLKCCIAKLVLSRNILYRHINPYYPIKHVRPPPLTEGQQYDAIMLNLSTPGLLLCGIWPISGSVFKIRGF